jgi:hypothetical protein
LESKKPGLKAGPGYSLSALAVFGNEALPPGARKLGLTFSIKSAQEKLYVKSKACAFKIGMLPKNSAMVTAASLQPNCK